MEPRIQYATTSDGVSIAFSVLGEGVPFLHMPNAPFSHITLDWQFLEYRRWYEELAKRRRLIRYDNRGSGLSDRSAEDYSTYALVLDLEAVVDHLELETFDLFGYTSSSPIAIAYAAKHPDRVDRLILWGAYSSYEEYLMQSPQLQSTWRVRDWVTFTETISHTALGWSEGEAARKLASTIRESLSPEWLIGKWGPARRAVDVTDLLAEVRAHTLVLHRRDCVFPPLALVQSVASRIPDARLSLLEGESVAPFIGDFKAVLNAIDEFLGEAKETRRELPEGMTAILFADIADSTALTERQGDAAFRERTRELDTSLREVIRNHEGIPVEGKLLGDGVLAVFTSARQAIECALRCGEAGGHRGLPLHLGVHAGDVIREEGNVYGGAVNIAARIAGASAPGEVLVSQTVRDLARTSAGVAFEDRGEHQLKGIDEPQRLFAVWGREG